MNLKQQVKVLLSFLDEQKYKTKQSDKDYWVWDKKEGDWILIKGSEFDSSRHSKEPN